MGADVYHKKYLEAQENDATWPQDYDFVATVDTDNLEVAFELTNSIDCAWWTNAKVISRFGGEGCRSTSVGDVIIIDGRPFQCARVGWEARLNWEGYPHGPVL